MECSQPYADFATLPSSLGAVFERGSHSRLCPCISGRAHCPPADAGLVSLSTLLHDQVDERELALIVDSVVRSFDGIADL